MTVATTPLLAAVTGRRVTDYGFEPLQDRRLGVLRGSWSPRAGGRPGAPCRPCAGPRAAGWAVPLRLAADGGRLRQRRLRELDGAGVNALRGPLTERLLRTSDLELPEPAPSVLDRLETAGHDRNGFCEMCWSAAGRRAQDQPSRSQSEHYLDIITEANAAMGADA